MEERTALNRASQYLERCDRLYSEHHTLYHNRLIIRAQRVYYRRFIAYTRATLPPHEARVAIARALHVRAQTNRKRLPDHEDWQALTLHQVRRAQVTRTRAMALSEYEHPTPKREPRERKPARLPRVHHPITGRMMYYDPATDTYHRQHPAATAATPPTNPPHAPMD
jgi:hypothetical protein